MYNDFLGIIVQIDTHQINVDEPIGVQLLKF